MFEDSPAGFSAGDGLAKGAEVQHHPTRGVTEHARHRPDKPALIMGSEIRTFKALDDRSNALAHFMAGLGITHEDSVAIMLTNGFEWFEVAVAADKLGATIVPINWHLKKDEIAYLLADSKARLLVAQPDYRDYAEAALKQAADCSLVVVGDQGPRGYETAIENSAHGAPQLPTSGYPRVSYYTSRTSGRPKGVMHVVPRSQPRSGDASDQVILWWWSERDVNICSGPAYHAGPFGYASVALQVGATTVILPRFDAREWITAVERHRVSRGFMVPGQFVRILELPDSERTSHDLTSLDLIVHGGAPCPVRVKREMMALLPACQIWELYGASEGGATRISPQEWTRKPGSVGTPWPGVVITVRDQDGNAVPPGTTGIVYITPARGARFSYRNDAEKTDEAWLGDSFTVGDMGYLDEDGYLFLTDRASDMIIRGGVNIYPREIENILCEHPAVADCTVFGVPDPRFNELIKAVVEIREAVTAEELQEWCRQRIADFKVPHFIELTRELPRTPTGKVMKRYLRDEHWVEQPSAVGTD